MTVDISKIKPGDEVTVRLVVRKADDTDVPLQVVHPSDHSGTEGVWVEANRVVSHTPRELQMGDKFRAGDQVFECVGPARLYAGLGGAGKTEVCGWNEAEGYVAFDASDLERIP
ncbi:hypothetical protein [Phenylobacterium sp.]|uniref:hypothetical protein n=1 Tax=Phenylobacterium sp. TaxID=1871053 RepID=UPI00262D290A|nr:hypothetical protein [Phenylobacterium sp.]